MTLNPVFLMFLTGLSLLISLFGSAGALIDGDWLSLWHLSLVSWVAVAFGVVLTDIPS